MMYILILIVCILYAVVMFRKRASSVIRITYTMVFLIVGVSSVFVIWCMNTVLNELDEYYPDQYEADMAELQSYENDIEAYRMEYSPSSTDHVYNSLVLCRDHLRDAINRMEMLQGRQDTYKFFTAYDITHRITQSR